LGQVLNIINYNRAFNGKRQIELFIPYLPFSRADRVFVEGDCHGLHVFIYQLVGICKTFGVSKIITLDNHNPKTRNWIAEEANRSGAGLIEVQELSAEPYIMAAILEEVKIHEYYKAKSSAGTRSINILFPDEGASRRYSIPNEIFGNTGTIKISKLFAKKNRDAATGKFLGFEIPDKTEFDENGSILIVDDICDGGGTFIGINEKLEEANIVMPGAFARTLRASLFVTHGIFSKGLGELEEKFLRIYTTDSIVYMHHNEEDYCEMDRDFFRVFNIVY
jgi:ribose-phosphate pyrophosphokinase